MTNCVWSHPPWPESNRRICDILLVMETAQTYEHAMALLAEIDAAREKEEE